MGMFDDDKGVDGNIMFPPKMGASITVTVVSKERVEQTENPKLNYKVSEAKGGGDHGYYDKFELADGKSLLCNVWKLYFALKESNMDFGVPIVISHPGSGVYKVETAKETAWEEEDGS